MKLSRIVLASVLALTACGTADTATTPAPGASGALTPIKLQLQWFYQAQFAGYIAAVDQGFYQEQGLDVTLLEGGVDIVPQTVLAQGKADYAIAWVPKALASREQGAGITDVGQIFARSGTYQVAWKDSGITKAADLKGKKVGNWGFGNEFELFAGMTKAGVDPGKDVTLVQQQFDMQALLKKEIDAAQAMSYNEYAQLLEAKNPATGKLYTADDFAIIDWKTEGSSMLQDAVWANTAKLNDPAYQQQTVKFLTATIKGWAFCRDNPEKCRDLVVAKGSKLGRSHQLWQMNEVSKLVWPAAAGGIGTVDETAWKQTVEISQTTRNQTGDTVLTRAPEGLAYTNDYIRQAIGQAEAAGVDVDGSGFQPATVTLTEGGA
ncbi:NitT/TauT family transport system substrate-binding protein [Actinoplanes campanulatus]|uniref:Thiamine pyrimidine synthase n=1 Tax=Actinoplanes campanulatus TaxID=113559 RepID=A0A7W5ANU0_9ACTN|nr:ABC transporter substrate-binding protein [Actinoplanes campanulatus]MBB3099555.1 NitT/TauT family transport system substrate-binding protein [Actinoplanes campanulatus]GGN42274.1 nitrate ABC transporter substrate-binding protein [Actinoplanes campanulatus]GID39904.1 nitrate ABC transporter substrate-binding protein [Actinoplanes campanulatus]